MKVAVSSSGKDLDSQLDPRFGRCAYFLIVETNDMSFEVFENENMALGGGAGIQSAQFVASKGAKAVITGSCGPNAVRTLSAGGVELFVGQTGTVGEVVERYKTGQLSPTTEANVSDHHGMRGGGPVRDAQARDSGGRMGMGRSRGMGRGRGMGMFGRNVSDQMGPGNLSKDQALKALKEQAVDLRKQMGEVEARIRRLVKSD